MEPQVSGRSRCGLRATHLTEPLRELRVARPAVSAGVSVAERAETEPGGIWMEKWWKQRNISMELDGTGSINRWHFGSDEFLAECEGWCCFESYSIRKSHPPISRGWLVVRQITFLMPNFVGRVLGLWMIVVPSRAVFDFDLMFDRYLYVCFTCGRTHWIILNMSKQ